MKLKLVFTGLVGFVLQHSDAGPACPFPFHLERNGTISQNDLYFHGSSPDQSFLTDAAGYTVIEDVDSSQYVYAIQNVTTGVLVSSGIVVGEGNPEEAGIPRGVHPYDEQHFPHRQLFKSSPSRGLEFYGRRLSLPSVMKNLVILIRFSDHSGRDLPSRNDFTILFNRRDSDHDVAPTGSVQDLFRINSYGKFTLQSSVYGWINLPNTEKYYANGISGFGSSRYFEALHFALDKVRKSYGVDLSAFDANNDGKVDMVTLIHSGYAAEIFGNDQYGASVKNRIWSHHWTLPSGSVWTSDGVEVYQYSTSPALFGLSGSNIGRIGVICHEIGHAIDLPDLYGTSDGNGIGSYDLMSNHWGFAPLYSQTQLFPPIMSPWTKMLVGWLDPIVITKSGTFTIEPSAVSEQVYRIDLASHGDEYLLIENRQPIGFELFLPQAGLAIWHIDETALDIEGYPGQPGAWPFNGKHYKVALLQADGLYHLEQRTNHGDDGDLYHGNGKNSISPSLDLFEGPFPNTDKYSGFPQQFPEQTGIRIRDISPSSLSMEFTVDFLKRLSTTFLGGNGAAGNMFDVFAKKSIVIRLIYLHLNEAGPTVVEVWTRTGTHVSFESKPWLWQRKVVASVDGRGRGSKTSLDVGGIQLNANTRYSFYIVLLDGKLRYTNGNSVGDVLNSNNDLIVYEGVGLSAPFHNVFSPRIWNGDLHYDVLSPLGGDRRLATNFDGGSGQDGVMFDVIPYSDMRITAFDLHMFDANEVMIRISSKTGSFEGSEKNCEDWELVMETVVVGHGMSMATRVEMSMDSAFVLKSEGVQSFYISIVNGTGLRYSHGDGSGTVVAEDEHLAIMEGVGVASQCGSTFWGRVFNGAIHYVLAD